MNNKNEETVLNSQEDRGNKEDVKKVVTSQDQYVPKEEETTYCSYAHISLC